MGVAHGFDHEPFLPARLTRDRKYTFRIFRPERRSYCGGPTTVP